MDLIFLLNFCFDFILLLSTSLLLKRNSKIKRLLLASLIGSLSIFILFIKINSIELFLIKIAISIIMLLVGFGYKDKKYFFTNFIYLYFVSILLGGFLYFLNLEFSYKNIGLIFINKGMSINFIVLLILSPIILYIYIKKELEVKKSISSYHKVKMYYKNKEYHLSGYLDTGNKLYDPYKKRCVSILYNKNIDVDNDKPFYIPYKTVNKNGVIQCIIVEKLVIDKKEYINQVVAVSNDKFIMDGVDLILHSDYKE